MNPSEPFKFRPGPGMQTALYNRTMAVNRVIYLSGVDIRQKSLEYKMVLDLQLWKRFYKDMPPGQWTINEEFCQNMATVIKEMEEQPLELKKEDYDKAVSEFMDISQTEEQEDEDVAEQPQSDKEDAGRQAESDKD